MAITVGDVFTKFTYFKPEDMKKLVGNENYNGRTVIPLTNIAKYRGQYANELSIFATEREKQNYTKLLSDNQKDKVNEQVGIKEDNSNQSGQNKPMPAHIPKNVSIYDIAKQNRQFA